MKLTRLFSTLAFLLVFAATAFAQQKTIVTLYDDAGRHYLAAFPSNQLPFHAEISPMGGVTSLIVNGQRITGEINLQFAGQDSYDPATNTLFISNESLNSAKGGSPQGNTTISGSLTVTGSCYFNSNIAMVTTIYGQLITSHELATGGASVTITHDVTAVPDPGGTVTMTLPTAVAGRHLDIYNESATYNVTDGGSNTVAPLSILHLTGVDVAGGGAAWK